jgi:hypothetical protein
MKGIPSYASEAYLNGWHTQRLGRYRSECPYNHQRQLVSYNAWVTGWNARRAAVDASYDNDEAQREAMQQDHWL